MTKIILVNDCDLINDEMKEDFSSTILQMQAIIETAIDGIIIINSNGLIEQVNSAACQLFDYQKNELMGQNVRMLMPQNIAKEHDGYLSKYIKTREAHIIGIGREVKGRKKDGTYFPFRLAVSEVILNDRIIFTGIVHDLTEVRRTQAELKATNAILEEKVEQRTKKLEELVNRLLDANKALADKEKALQKALEREKELNALKSRFVSMASHEFRTPLSTVSSSASLIKRYADAAGQEKREKHINRIKSAVANLTGILNDFLSLNKLETGGVEAVTQEMDLETLTRNIAGDLQTILKKDQSIKLSYDAPKQIYSDPKIIKNILFNLMSNAIKYSPPGKVIQLSMLTKSDTIEIRVKDEGIGIPLHDQEHLFERFFRATNVENIQGTGLGLNIVKQYLDLLNGSITFISEENKGTTFIAHIPYRK